IFVVESAQVHPRLGHTTTALPSGELLIAGGVQGSTSAPTELYDSRTGTLRATASQPSPRSYHAATIRADGRVVLSGGFYAGSAVDVLEVYDPATARFSALSSALSRRRGPTTASLPSGDALVSGGRIDEPIPARQPVSTALVEVLNPETGSARRVA